VRNSLLFAALLVASVSAAPQTKPKPRLFAPVDLSLLEAPDRDQWQKPDQTMDALNIADGSVVAEIGAAGGWFTVRLARRVGPNGLVYAEDIQPLMIDAIERRVQRENFRNVRTILGTTEDPRLPPGLDAILMCGSYHEMDAPVKVLENAARALKPQGRLGIVEFTRGGGGPGPAADQRVEPEAVIKAAQAAGLRLVLREPVPPFQYLLVFGRPTARQSAGMTPDATTSLSRSGTTNGTNPAATAAESPRAGPATSASQATPPAKTSARPASIARNDVT
jgi:ubiquinone/menaquinone biosynthesis C-methylase UbiE